MKSHRLLTILLCATSSLFAGSRAASCDDVTYTSQLIAVQANNSGPLRGVINDSGDIAYIKRDQTQRQVLEVSTVRQGRIRKVTGRVDLPAGDWSSDVLKLTNNGKVIISKQTSNNGVITYRIYAVQIQGNGTLGACTEVYSSTNRYYIVTASNAGFIIREEGAGYRCIGCTLPSVPNVDWLFINDSGALVGTRYGSGRENILVRNGIVSTIPFPDRIELPDGQIAYTNPNYAELGAFNNESMVAGYGYFQLPSGGLSWQTMFLVDLSEGQSSRWYQVDSPTQNSNPLEIRDQITKTGVFIVNRYSSIYLAESKHGMRSIRLSTEGWNYMEHPQFRAQMNGSGQLLASCYGTDNLCLMDPIAKTDSSGAAEY